jgi:hypothetical protein
MMGIAISKNPRKKIATTDARAYHKLGPLA